MTQMTLTKAERTLAAARKLFFEKGFGGTSSREIAQVASTSKAAIYDNFGSMEGLLSAVITHEIERFDPGETRKITDYDSFRDALVSFGAGMLAFLDLPETIRFSRIMHEEARHQPQITKLYFTASYVATSDRVLAIIEAGLPFTTAREVPEMGERYVAMLKGHRYEMAVLGQVERPFPTPNQTSSACFDAWFAQK